MQHWPQAAGPLATVALAHSVPLCSIKQLHHGHFMLSTYGCHALAARSLLTPLTNDSIITTSFQAQLATVFTYPGTSLPGL